MTDPDDDDMDRCPQCLVEGGLHAISCSTLNWHDEDDVPGQYVSAHGAPVFIPDAGTVTPDPIPLDDDGATLDLLEDETDDCA